MKTIACPACKSVNDFEAQNCARCGESLVAAKLQDALDGLRNATARLEHHQAGRSGGFSSINGFGTGLLDYRPREDGTWDAIRWVTAGGIPLVPLGGYVIQPHHEEFTYGRHTASFSILDRFPLTAQRVLRTYLLLAVALLPLILGWMNSRALERALGGPKAFFAMLVCVVWAGYVVYGRIRNDSKVYKPLPPRPAV